MEGEVTNRENTKEPDVALTRAPGAQLLSSVRAQVEQLLEGFRADPGGKAGQMIRTLLFSCLVREQTRQEEQTLGELQEGERSRAALLEDVETLAVRRLNAEVRNQKLAQALRQARLQQGQVGRYVRGAQKALAGKKPFDYDRALKQISAMIGVGLPLKHRVESQVPGMPAYNLTEEECRDFEQGRGPAWEEEQRRRREWEQKRLSE